MSSSVPSAMPAIPSAATSITPQHALFVGVDIAARSFTACVLAPGGRPERPFTCEQSPTGLAALSQRLERRGAALGDLLVVLEATSTYWIALATDLDARGIAVSVINPAQAQYFAKALLKRPKTDALDAQTLAQLAQALLTPARWAPPPRLYHELQQRLAQRDALLHIRLQVANQLHALLANPHIVASVRARMAALVETLSEQIAVVDAEIGALLANEEAWTRSVRLLETIPGVGRLTACWIIATTLNFATCPTLEAATQYAGLAPVERSSGTSVRGRARIGHAGKRRLRTALYMATLSAGRLNPAIRECYERLRAAGKPVKVARCAAARKRLHQAWAIAHSGAPFDPSRTHGALSTAEPRSPQVLSGVPKCSQKPGCTAAPAPPHTAAPPRKTRAPFHQA